jgi:hypothetical protein
MITAIAILLGLLAVWCVLGAVLHAGAAKKARDGKLYGLDGRHASADSIAQRGALYTTALILALGFLGLLLK